MLLRFSVENFMSYRDPQVISMIAGKHTKHNGHLVDCNGKRVLKGSFFFGANAAGKSNLFQAVSFAKKIVNNGLRQQMLLNKHFRIESVYASKPGVFQFDIFANGHFYSYGFAISYQNACVEEEWLYLLDTREIAIFERSSTDGVLSISTDYSFSDENLSQSFKVFSENVADDKLFLSEIAERKLIDQRDFSAYADVRNWFRNLRVISPESHFLNKQRMVSETDAGYDLERLLKEFDTGIEGISVSEEGMEDLLGFLPEPLKQDIMQEVELGFNEINENGEKPHEIQVNVAGRSLKFGIKDSQILGTQLVMNHGNQEDLFELADESDGTQRLFDLIPIYQMGRIPVVVFVDELDRSFHTKLVTRFIQLFYEKTLGIQSQLIATVHDSNVMDLDLLRQDEIWFVERQSDHSSRIYSLNKFKERFDKKVSKGYLLGKYGAIPCFSQLDIQGEADE